MVLRRLGCHEGAHPTSRFLTASRQLPRLGQRPSRLTGTGGLERGEGTVEKICESRPQSPEIRETDSRWRSGVERLPQFVGLTKSEGDTGGGTA